MHICIHQSSAAVHCSIVLILHHRYCYLENYRERLYSCDKKSKSTKMPKKASSKCEKKKKSESAKKNR